jgi:hypothetical protein
MEVNRQPSEGGSRDPWRLESSWVLRCNGVNVRVRAICARHLMYLGPRKFHGIRNLIAVVLRSVGKKVFDSSHVLRRIIITALT